LKEIHTLVAPYVHRKDASELKKVLPPLQEVVLYVRQSRIQCRLYRGYDFLRKQEDSEEATQNYNNFFRLCSATRPLHNHPGCLLLADEKSKSPLPKSDEWWKQFIKPEERELLLHADAGYKFVLLLHILVEAVKIGDRCLIYSESIQTLDFLEGVLALKNWQEHVPSLDTSKSDSLRLGNWERDIDYLRIDGSTSSENRGVAADLFNSEHTKSGSNRVRAILISKAGGLGM
jgi:SNF2 family DNA or RNA helicase